MFVLFAYSCKQERKQFENAFHFPPSLARGNNIKSNPRGKVDKPPPTEIGSSKLIRRDLVHMWARGLSNGFCSSHVHCFSWLLVLSNVTHLKCRRPGHSNKQNGNAQCEVPYIGSRHNVITLPHYFT